MKGTWVLFILMIMVLGLIVLVVLMPKSKHRKIDCDVSDAIIYPKERYTTETVYTCPDKRQRMEVVREHLESTYIRCSCHE